MDKDHSGLEQEHGGERSQLGGNGKAGTSDKGLVVQAVSLGSAGPTGAVPSAVQPVHQERESGVALPPSVAGGHNATNGGAGKQPISSPPTANRLPGQHASDESLAVADGWFDPSRFVYLWRRPWLAYFDRPKLMSRAVSLPRDSFEVTIEQPLCNTSLVARIKVSVAFQLTKRYIEGTYRLTPPPADPNAGMREMGRDMVQASIDKGIKRLEGDLTIVLDQKRKAETEAAIVRDISAGLSRHHVDHRVVCFVERSSVPDERMLSSEEQAVLKPFLTYRARLKRETDEALGEEARLSEAGNNAREETLQKLRDSKAEFDRTHLEEQEKKQKESESKISDLRRQTLKQEKEKEKAHELALKNLEVSSQIDLAAEEIRLITDDLRNKDVFEQGEQLEIARIKAFNQRAKITEEARLAQAEVNRSVRAIELLTLREEIETNTAEKYKHEERMMDVIARIAESIDPPKIDKMSVILSPSGNAQNSTNEIVSGLIEPSTKLVQIAAIGKELMDTIRSD